MRIQLDVSKSRASQLQSLMASGDFKSYSELVNNAVTLVAWAVKHVQNGEVIVAFDERRNKMKELSMPFLQHVADEYVSKDEQSEDEESIDPEEALSQAQLEQQRLSAELAKSQADLARSQAEVNSLVVDLMAAKSQAAATGNAVTGKEQTKPLTRAAGGYSGY